LVSGGNVRAQRDRAMTITADTFVDAAAQVCVRARELDVDAAVTLHRPAGPVGIVVENFRDVTDDARRWVLTEEAWRINPMMVELRRQLAIIGPEVLDVPAYIDLVLEKGYVAAGERKYLGVPMLGPDGWFGSVSYSLHVAPPAFVERQLTFLATELTVWCTARGISTLPDVRPLAPRQQEIAALAADGRTNPEIAGALGISINTVKLRLKQAFERFGVDNRTELANVLRRLAPLDGIQPGITRRATVTITRGVPDRVLDSEL
jgi:DNA-binding CsgD family transcriptional regulator